MIFQITRSFIQIWSLGVLLWVMLFGENPFENVVAAEECNLIFPKNEALVSEVTEIPPKMVYPNQFEEEGGEFLGRSNSSKWLALKFLTHNLFS